jgi:hypothetical protein
LLDLPSETVRPSVLQEGLAVWCAGGGVEQPGLRAYVLVSGWSRVKSTTIVTALDRSDPTGSPVVLRGGFDASQAVVDGWRLASSQAWLIAYFPEGNRPRPLSVAAVMRSSTRGWAQCRAYRNARCPTPSVFDGEGSVAPAVGLLQQRQRGAGVWP